MIIKKLNVKLKNISIYFIIKINLLQKLNFGIKVIVTLNIKVNQEINKIQNNQIKKIYINSFIF